VVREEVVGVAAPGQQGLGGEKREKREKRAKRGERLKRFWNSGQQILQI
jgi:hypothetical protein